MYAIVDIAGQQFKVEKNQKIFVHRLNEKEGGKVDFYNVLLIDNDKSVVVGAPEISGAAISAKVVSHVKGDKVLVFKKKRRKGYQKMNGHRQQFTEIVVEEIIEKGAKKPTAEKSATLGQAQDTAANSKKATETKKTTAKPAAEKSAKIAKAKNPATKATETKKAETKPAAEKQKTAAKKESAEKTAKTKEKTEEKAPATKKTEQAKKPAANKEKKEEKPASTETKKKPEAKKEQKPSEKKAPEAKASTTKKTDDVKKSSKDKKEDKSE